MCHEHRTVENHCSILLLPSSMGLRKTSKSSEWRRTCGSGRGGGGRKPERKNKLKKNKRKFSDRFFLFSVQLEVPYDACRCRTAHGYCVRRIPLVSRSLTASFPFRAERFPLSSLSVSRRNDNVYIGFERRHSYSVHSFIYSYPSLTT